ncbi:type III secretion system inner membrane ring subunit SctD [Thalassomonas viridans]|uniref:Type III secretion system inner membrane ring subunit SctD n=1 Tax=Thalassomonas viridans TaxID=137584 RepID=A0AAE9Z8F6_9GAMM|nr:type III secretion system inner membrane ring subunit SctD [Thalassomonas viridans]WDE08616.1 type III secretion system inner membrane ring subunit SctD [Thalassomonas viridans]
MTTWYLRVLTGPQKNAEIELEPGSQYLGAGNDCDVILQSDDIQDKHFELTLEEEKLTLTNLVETCFLQNGTESPDKCISLNHGDYICVGDLVLGFASAEYEWPESVLAADVSAEGGNKADDDDWGMFSSEADESEDEDEIEELVAPPKKGLTTARLAFAASVVFCSTVAAAGIAIKQANVKAEQLAFFDPESLRNELAKQFPKARLTLAREDEQHPWQLTGYSASTADFRELSAWLEHTYPKVVNRVISQELLISSTQQALQALGFSEIKAISTDKAGVLALTGEIKRPTKWQKAFHTLQRDIAGVSAWQDQTEDKRWLPKPDIQVDSVNIGESPFLLTRNGKSIYEGDLIDGLFTVEKVALDYVIMNFRDQKIKYMVSDL